MSGETRTSRRRLASACGLPANPARRRLLQLASGMMLAGVDRRGSAAANELSSGPGFGRARSVIVIYASGGQSQLDMWDPKPAAPLEIRGEFRARSTAVPGVALSEHLPRMARALPLCTLIRCMSHEDRDHGSATYLTLTGRYHRRLSSNPDPSPEDFPCLGAALQRSHPRGEFLYDAIHINGPALVPERESPGQDGGFLGRSVAPLVLGDVSRGPVAIAGLDLRPEVTPRRIHSRLSLGQALDQQARRLESASGPRDWRRLRRQAMTVLTEPRYRRAFDLSQEDSRLRDRYGRHRSGQACLLARRLAEAGIPLITVIWNHSNRGQDRSPDVTDEYGWDTHNDIFESLKTRLLPRFDATFAALLEDLEQRGLLEETLVLCMGEFGRAPQVALEPRFSGATPGRKHWPDVYSIVAAGAGVARGAVLGASDRLGAEPVGQRFGPWDVAATIYHALGIDPAGHFVDSLQRPYPLSVGQPMLELYT